LSRLARPCSWESAPSSFSLPATLIRGVSACGRSRYPADAWRSCAVMDDGAAVIARLDAYSSNITHAIRAHPALCQATVLDHWSNSPLPAQPSQGLMLPGPLRRSRPSRWPRRSSCSATAGSSLTGLRTCSRCTCACSRSPASPPARDAPLAPKQRGACDAGGVAKTHLHGVMMPYVLSLWLCLLSLHAVRAVIVVQMLSSCWTCYHAIRYLITLCVLW
jgi:hypothetical protein